MLAVSICRPCCACVIVRSATKFRFHLSSWFLSCCTVAQVKSSHPQGRALPVTLGEPSADPLCPLEHQWDETGLQDCSVLLTTTTNALCCLEPFASDFAQFSHGVAKLERTCQIIQSSHPLITIAITMWSRGHLSFSGRIFSYVLN